MKRQGTPGDRKIILTKRYCSPCGELTIGSFDERLCLCNWATEKCEMIAGKRLRKVLNAEYKEGMSDVIQETVRQLNEYFEMKRKAFDLPLLLVGTDFQKLVWQKLRETPYGRTISYAELAQAINHPAATRAAANANRANAISIIIPCHRVIGSNGALTGYAGGLDTKRQLLELEEQTANALF